MKPNCSETTAFSGRIFRKPFSPPFLPERMMAPQGGGALPALKDDSGEGSKRPSFPSAGVGTWPWVFNFYAEYIMRNAGLEEAQAGIKIAWRNSNNCPPHLWQKAEKN